MKKDEFKKGHAYWQTGGIIICKISKWPEIQVKFEVETIWLTQAQNS